jgi:hypothetical protein
MGTVGCMIFIDTASLTAGHGPTDVRVNVIFPEVIEGE